MTAKRLFDPLAFEGKVVLVCGASGGLGSAVARTLAGAGASLSLMSSRAEHVAKLRDEFQAHCLQADIRNVGDCDRAVAEVLAHHGRIDALVNCAGVWTEADSSQVTEAQWDECVDINLKGAFFLCSRAIEPLRATRGSIVNVASDAGLVGNAGCAVYCASKGGLVLMSKALALELAPFGVRVNVVCPADMATPMLDGQAAKYGGAKPHAYLDRLLSRYPQKAGARFIAPDEVAQLVAYLISDAAAPITGAALSVDFGITAGY